MGGGQYPLLSSKGFTLIELLAVIIILGVLLLIAIPSVTSYISTSRKKTYLATADKYIGAVVNKVNALDYNFAETDTMYYVPVSLIELEKGGKSPYGEWIEAYVVVTFDGDSYKYYWTSVDDSGMGIELTLSKELSIDKIQGGMTSVNKGMVKVEGKKYYVEVNNDNSISAKRRIKNQDGTDPESYIVTFDCNEVECTINPREKEVEKGDRYGELPEAVGVGYTFLGWYTQKENGEWIKASTTVELTTDQTLYAHWEGNTYEINYDCNGESCSLGTKEVTYGSPYGTLATPPTKPDYYAEWYTAPTGGSKIESTTIVTITANQTLYAQWKVENRLAAFAAIGDYVNYDAGTWTETKAIPVTSFTFGGYTSGNSRNSSVTCNSRYGTPSYSGWRVLSKDTSIGEVKLIHAGQPECFIPSSYGTDSNGNIEKILTGNTNRTINSSYPSEPRDWSMYVNSSYAVSATAFTKLMLDSWNGSTVPDSTYITNNLIKTNSFYYLGTAYPFNTYGVIVVQDGGFVGSSYSDSWGVRPVITMKSNIATTGKVGNVWQLQ